MFEDFLRGFGGDYEKAANNMIDKKYKFCKSRFNRTLYRMKSGRFKIQDYDGKSFGMFYDLNMAKKNYVEQYEKIYGIIKLKDI